MQLDNIYTPTKLALEMINKASVIIEEGDFIADFSVGHGELLNVAQSIYPMAEFIATDIDRNTIRNLHKNKIDWKMGICNFLNPRSRIGSPVLRKVIGETKLILLNPPFSCRGGKRVAASAAGVKITCSVGLAFVINSIDYLKLGGTIVAVLPSGSISSERDDIGWTILRKLGSIEILMNNGDNTFPEANVHTTVFKWTKKQTNIKNADEMNCERNKGECLAFTKGTITLLRGNLQMNEIVDAWDVEGIPLIHSTNLQDGQISCTHKIINTDARLVKGPLVLIPRVGKPIKTKMVCYLGKNNFALSDCIIAFLCTTDRHAINLTNTNALINYA